MPTFGKESQEQLKTCHPDLQRLLETAIQYYDFSIVCGHRGQEDQHKAFVEGKSKLDWPHGKHNKFPSEAVDVIPYPSGYSNPKEQILLAGFLKGLAVMLGIDIRWGGDWDSDNDMDDEKGLIDYPHFEIRR